MIVRCDLTLVTGLPSRVYKWSTVGVRGEGARLHCWRGANRCSHYGEQRGGSLKTTSRAATRPCSPAPGTRLCPTHRSAHSGTVHNGQHVEETWISVNRWTGGAGALRLNAGLLGHWREWNSICRHTEGPRHHHTEWSKSDRETCDINYV